ncbi:MAG: hypothetical protein JWO07_656 [Candidatus Saccharibacteria bacterium]|nr:hypothetical protein [Candidatus Saccharibacteria bacterium]
MIRLEFATPLTALEIREPAVAACATVATEMGWYAKFQQPQQAAFDGFSHQRNRPRIGNGKHKNWYVDYQQEHQSSNKPTILGRIALTAPIDIENMEYGGFNYGDYPEPSPTYGHLTVQTAHERWRNPWNVPELSPEVAELTEQEMMRKFARFLNYQLPLF